MATYVELFNLRNNSVLRNKISIAIIVSAETIRTDDAVIQTAVNSAVDAFANGGV